MTTEPQLDPLSSEPSEKDRAYVLAANVRNAQDLAVLTEALHVAMQTVVQAIRLIDNDRPLLAKSLLLRLRAAQEEELPWVEVLPDYVPLKPHRLPKI
jgi:hypothetical protein